MSCFPHCTDAPLSIVGDRYAEPIDYTAHESNTAFDGYHLDLAAIFADKSPRRLEIRGYFQNYALLRPAQGAHTPLARDGCIQRPL